MAEGRIVRQNLQNLRAQQTSNQVNEVVEQQQTERANTPISEIIKRSEDNFATSAAGMNKAPALITEVCKLPSKGQLYGGRLGETIELRSMTTIEERMRLSGENFWSTMADIITRCMVGTEFNARNLVDFDFFAAMIKLRTVTYGNIYKTKCKCLSCETVQDYDVNLDTLITKELEDNFEEPIKIGPMPRSGDILGIRFLRVFDHIDIQNKKAEYEQSKRKNKEDLGDPEYTLEMEKMLVSVNGTELDSIAKKIYIENMSGMDSSYFHKEVDKLYYGVRRVGVGECKEEDCDGAIIFQVAPDEEFFRASFDN